MKSMETGRQDGGSDKNHAPFSVGKTGNISRKFLTIILKIFDKNFERLQLDEKYAVTNWDQGKMSMGMLEQILKTLVTEYDVIGVDICGMYPEENSLPEYLRAERVNIRSDEELYRFLQKNLFCWASHK